MLMWKNTLTSDEGFDVTGELIGARLNRVFIITTEWRGAHLRAGLGCADKKPTPPPNGFAWTSILAIVKIFTQFAWTHEFGSWSFGGGALCWVVGGGSALLCVAGIVANFAMLEK